MKLDIPSPAVLDGKIRKKVQNNFDNLIKPVGSLARLEDITCLYAAASRQEKPSSPQKKLLVFASDHGVAQALDFLYTTDDSFFYFNRLLEKKSGLAVLAKALGADVAVVELGLKKGNSENHIAAGTYNILHGPAMTETQFEQAFAIGRAAVEQAADAGAQVLALGSLGAGAEFSETALLYALCGEAVERFVSSSRHITWIRASVEKYALDDHMEQARCLGGFELAALMGAIAQAAHLSLPVFGDSTAVLLGAFILAEQQPLIKEFIIPVCTSCQPEQDKLMKMLGFSTMLDLLLYGTGGEGGLLGFSLLDAGVKALAEMDSFGAKTVHGPLENSQ